MKLHTDRYQDAGELYRELMLKQEKVLGDKHEATMKSMSQLARCLRFQGLIVVISSRCIYTFAFMMLMSNDGNLMCRYALFMDNAS